MCCAAGCLGLFQFCECFRFFVPEAMPYQLFFKEPEPSNIPSDWFRSTRRVQSRGPRCRQASRLVTAAAATRGDTSTFATALRRGAWLFLVLGEGEGLELRLGAVILGLPPNTLKGL